jgi:abequosyltransferase
MESEKQPLLSFAIPTYNFGKFIAETVRTIEDGAEVLLPSQFEIVILDGGSADNTDDVVRELADQYGNIRYVKQAERGGIDRDMNAVAEMAKGKYIWLFSADDLLERGWDKCIAPLIEKGGDVFLVPATLCDIQMEPLRQNPIFRGCAGQEPIEFHLTPEDDSLSGYLNRAATLEALFSYMSSIIVNANLWHTLPIRDDYFGSCWAHCARLMPVFSSRKKITYLNRFLIKKRGGNDSFMSNGFVARIAIAVDGWDKIISEFFAGNLHREVLYNALRKDMPIMLFIYAKISSQKVSEIERLNRMARLLYVERRSSTKVRISYLVYRMIPSSTVLNLVIRPVLPGLIRIRHKMKSLFV